MFTKSGYYAGNFYSRQKARFKSRGGKLSRRRNGLTRSKLSRTYKKSPSVSSGRSRSSSISSGYLESPILVRPPNRLNYDANLFFGSPRVQREDGSEYVKQTGPGYKKARIDDALTIIEKVIEDSVGHAAEWETRRRFAAKKKKSLRKKKGLPTGVV